jgi:putative DNA primase/helicase
MHLLDIPNWVNWRREGRDNEVTKIPYRPHEPLQRARAGDPRTWSTYQRASANLHNQFYRFTGIGFELYPETNYIIDSQHGESFTRDLTLEEREYFAPHITDRDGLRLIVIDLDHCREPTGPGVGKLEAWAETIIDTIHSYTEISPSGTGVHIFVYGEPLGTRKRKGQFEIYDIARYITVTQDMYKYTDILANSEGVRNVYTEYLGEDTTVSTTTQSFSRNLDDETVIYRALTAKNGDVFRKLWRGDYADYKVSARFHNAGESDRSAADLAICAILAFWTRGDAAQIDRIFRRSQLYKTDHRMPDESAKWDRRDYRERTLAKAIEGVR